MRSGLLFLMICITASTARAAEAEALLAAAQKAIQAGEHLNAGNHLRQILLKDPDHEQAYLKLLEITPHIQIPVDEKVRAELLERLGDKFQLHATDHFVLAYNTRKPWAEKQGRLMELAHHNFFVAFTKAGFRPWPLSRRQICLLFEEHADFSAHALKTDKVDMGRFGGYYSPRFNRTMFYDEKTNPQIQEAQDTVLEAQANVTDLKRRLAATTHRPLKSRLQDQIASASSTLTQTRTRRMLIHQSISNANAGKTTHETVHQLSYNTGLQTRGVMHPFWLSEGLATNFELLPPATLIGPKYLNTGRKAELVQAYRARRMTSLSEFVALHRPAPDLDKAKAQYAQGWVLFRFLFLKHPAELRQYMTTLAGKKSGRRTPEALRAEFIKAFGPISKLQGPFNLYVGLFQ
jgi:hypothetical protein